MKINSEGFGVGAFLERVCGQHGSAICLYSITTREAPADPARCFLKTHWVMVPPHWCHRLIANAEFCTFLLHLNHLISTKTHTHTHAKKRRKTRPGRLRYYLLPLCFLRNQRGHLSKINLFKLWDRASDHGNWINKKQSSMVGLWFFCHCVCVEKYQPQPDTYARSPISIHENELEQIAAWTSKKKKNRKSCE